MIKVGKEYKFKKGTMNSDKLCNIFVFCVLSYFKTCSKS